MSKSERGGLFCLAELRFIAGLKTGVAVCLCLHLRRCETEVDEEESYKDTEEYDLNSSEDTKIQFS